MTANSHNIASLADRLTTLADAYKADVDAVIEDAKRAEVDTSALRRLVSWQRKDATKRTEQEAIDHQYRFLAGELDEPAALPAEGELAEAARHYADKLTVRQVAGVMKVSVGKAQKLKTLAALFTVHAEMNVNTSPHDPKTGEIPQPSHATANAGGGDDTGLVTQSEPAEVARVAPPTTDTRTFDEIAGPLPDRLRRERVRA